MRMKKAEQIFGDCFNNCYFPLLFFSYINVQQSMMIGGDLNRLKMFFVKHFVSLGTKRFIKTSVVKLFKIQNLPFKVFKI